MTAGSKTALVTGASKGIGAAIARRLAQGGYDVAVHYHTARDGAERTADAVRGAGQEAILFQADLGDVERARDMAEEVLDALGGLAVLVNNAGIYHREGLAEATAESWAVTQAVNAQAAFQLCKAFAPGLVEQRGSIVNIASIKAATGSSHGAHYAASKAALLGLTRSLALELGPKGVRVNAVCPGYIATDMLAGDSPEKRAQREAEVPLGRVGEPEDVAGVVAWLVGQDAAYVTGQTLHVNGGLYIG